MRKKFIIGGIILLVPIVFLAYMGFKSSLTYYYEVDQILQQSEAQVGKTVRIGGQVLPGAQTDVGKFELRFTIIDIANQDGKIDVVYHGAVPDTFKEGVDVIVEGKWAPGAAFQAKSIITKCASKYIPSGVTTAPSGGK
jgi:cytochrome c-type biogenesis protein CcmE